MLKTTNKQKQKTYLQSTNNHIYIYVYILWKVHGHEVFNMHSDFGLCYGESAQVMRGCVFVCMHAYMCKSVSVN